MILLGYLRQKKAQISVFCFLRTWQNIEFSYDGPAGLFHKMIKEGMTARCRIIGKSQIVLNQKVLVIF